MFTEGHRIRVSLVELCKSQVWLVGELKNRGITTDAAELSATLSGVRRGPKAEAILRATHEIIEECRGTA